MKVLSASADVALRHSRELLLRDQGCDVKTSLSTSHALELIQSHSFDVLVCGNSLTPKTCRQLAKQFRARNPRGKIIEILSARWSAPMNLPDATAVDPEELIAAIRDFAHTSEQIQRDGLRGDLLRVRLNGGEISCPYCQIQLLMDSIMDTIMKAEACPSCNKAFVIVNDPPVNP